nr:hypothetical protein [Kibdelosporangium sp. MJ126-NF4]CTQ92781.1 hypothetical protein [Kibdelosporangium sp. MJ126-NF4]
MLTRLRHGAQGLVGQTDTYAITSDRDHVGAADRGETQGYRFCHGAITPRRSPRHDP